MGLNSSTSSLICFFLHYGLVTPCQAVRLNPRLRDFNGKQKDALKNIWNYPTKCQYCRVTLFASCLLTLMTWSCWKWQNIVKAGCLSLNAWWRMPCLGIKCYVELLMFSKNILQYFLNEWPEVIKPLWKKCFYKFLLFSVCTIFYMVENM